MSTQTHLVHRTWLERLKLWRHAYETKISGGRHEAVGRGPTPRESQEAAERRWVAEQSAEKERGEIAIIERFLPKQLSDAELEKAVKETIAAIGAQGMKDMGRTMAALKERYAGQMDSAKSSQVVKRLLG